MSEFSVEVREIETIAKEYAFSLRSQWLSEALSDSSVTPDPGYPDGSVQVKAQRAGDQIVIRGQLQAHLQMPCHRCLEPVAFKVQSELVALLREKPVVSTSDTQGKAQQSRAKRPPKEPDAIELEAQDLDEDYYEGNQIVLDHHVRDQLLLECPMQALCTEPCTAIAIPEHVRPPADFDRENQPQKSGLTGLEAWIAKNKKPQD